MRYEALPRKCHLHGAREFLVWDTFVIALQVDKRRDGVRIQLTELFNALVDMPLEALGKSDLVGGQDQFHTRTI